MKFIMGLVLTVTLLAYCQSYAEEKTGALDKWLKDMRAMVEKVVPKKSDPQTTTAVSGVRSADENTGDALYWRGKKENISEEELAEFSGALKSAEQGKKEEAIKKFEEFIKHHPSSAMTKDAKITIRNLKSS